MRTQLEILEAGPKEKPTRRKQEGRGLELDIMKKIGAQLDRLGGDYGASRRVVAYVESWAREQSGALPLPQQVGDGLDL